MKQQDLEKLYRNWPDEKLLDAFKKRIDYTETALAAMLVVMSERNLGDAVAQEFRNEKTTKELMAIAEAEDLEQKQKRYEIKMLGVDASAKEFAEKSRINGEYMSGQMASSKSKGLRGFLIMIGSVILIMGVIAVGTGVPLNAVAYVIAGVIGIACIASGVLLFRESKASYHLRHVANEDVFEVKYKGFYFKAKAPFNYFAYWYKVENVVHAIKISHPVLCLCITNKENESVIVTGALTALQDRPPAWPFMWDVQRPKDARYFNEIVGQRMDVLKLKKILDGLCGK